LFWAAINNYGTNCRDLMFYIAHHTRSSFGTHENKVIARPAKLSNVSNLAIEHPGASVMTRTAMRTPGTRQPAKRCQKDGIDGCAICSIWRKTQMDVTTLLIIVVLVLLLGGGGWYGRGRWY
jgi:hypothetical protein